MGDKTGIQWTDATWNPTTGCTKVSAGCKHCYAETMALRLQAMGQPRYRNGFALTLHEEVLSQPLRWQRPRRIFVNSMSDLFHTAVPFEFIDRVFAVMALAPQHQFQILTKRPERMAHYFLRRPGQPPPAGTAADVTMQTIYREYDRTANALWEFLPKPLRRRINQRRESWTPHFSWPLPNVWLGTSAEDQQTADTRISELLQTPAAVHFVSAEPLLGPIELDSAWLKPDDEWVPGFKAAGEWTRIDWLIAGAESGPGARPMDENWVRSLRDHCRAHRVPFFYKQRLENGRKVGLPPLDGIVWDQFPR